jgi:hypothetical protein
VKCMLLLSDFDQTWNVSTDFSKTLQYKISWKSVQPFSSCYIRTDRQDEAYSRIFLQLLFVKTPKESEKRFLVRVG